MQEQGFIIHILILIQDLEGSRHDERRLVRDTYVQYSREEDR